MFAHTHTHKTLLIFLTTIFDLYSLHIIDTHTFQVINCNFHFVLVLCRNSLEEKKSNKDPNSDLSIKLIYQNNRADVLYEKEKKKFVVEMLVGNYF